MNVGIQATVDGRIIRKSSGNFVLAGTGVSLSIFSIFWTWGGARLSDRLLRKGTTRTSSANLLRRSIKVALSINLLGMLATIIGAEIIIGALATKLLTMQGAGVGFGFNAAAASLATQTLQPLDILVVQGNTNTMLSHFISLACALYQFRWVDIFDPPSTGEKSRSRK